MKYNATIRRKKGHPATMNDFHAETIYGAAEKVRNNFGLHTDDPHRGFVINEVRTLPTKAIKEGK